jgi:signal transduction histidine kinase
MLALFGGLMALGSYPMARQITRRLEKVQQKVEAFGSGDLSARAQVCGKDEVAMLATSFNAAASKIETLIGQQKRMLASASHELRSPLARVRMAVELMETAEPTRRRELAAQVEGDVQELDDLVEDLLLAVRAEAAPSTRERLDLLNLVSEVAAQSSLHAQGTSVEVEVNRRRMRRLVRNLIENARTHGHGKNVEVHVAVHDGKAQIVVEDDGPGVPESERKRIFDPFYRPEGHNETDHGGVGLGLSLVRQIATHHQGLCWVEPREGGGSRFIVELPAV